MTPSRIRTTLLDARDAARDDDTRTELDRFAILVEAIFPETMLEGV